MDFTQQSNALKRNDIAKFCHHWAVRENDRGFPVHFGRTTQSNGALHASLQTVTATAATSLRILLQLLLLL